MKDKGRYHFWLLLAACSFSLCLAQAQPRDSLEAIDYLKRANKLTSAHSLDSAKVLYEAAEVFFSDAGILEFHIDAVARKASLFMERGAYQTADSLLKIARALGEAEHPLLHPYQGIVMSTYGVLYERMGDYDESVKYHKIRLEILEEFPDKVTQVNIAGANINLGVTYHKMGLEQLAIQHHFRGLQILRDHVKADHIYAGFAYNNLATCYQKLGDYGLAIDYLHKALAIKRKHYGKNSLRLITTLINLGANYSELGLNEKGLEIQQQALAIARNQKVRSYLGEITALTNLGLIQKRLKRFQEALALYNEAYLLAQEHLSPFSQPTLDLVTNMGIVHRRLGNIDQAIELQQKLLRVLKENRSPYDLDIGSALASLGKSYDALEDHEKALAYYQQALHIFDPNFEINNIYAYPSQIETTILPQVIKDLNAKGKSFLALFKRDAKERDLLGAHQSYGLACAYTDSLRQIYDHHDSRLLIVSDARESYEGAIETALLIHEQLGLDGYKEEAFRLTQNSKSVLLREYLQDSQAREFADIPKELTEREQELKRSLSFYERQVFKEGLKAERMDTAKYSLLQEKLFNLGQQRDSLLNTLENNYPKYFQLKYRIPQTSLKDLSAYLKEEGSFLLEYFWGNDQAYVFALSDTQLAYRRILKQEELKTSLKEFRNLAGSFKDFDAQAFEALSYDLSKKLLPEELLADLSSFPQSLVVIPDGPMGYVPFDLLRTGTNKNSRYLIESHKIRYAYASPLLIWNAEGKKHKAEGWIGFAPEYDAEKYFAYQAEQPKRDALPNAFPPLLKNQEEIQNIADLTSGEAYLGNMATEEIFRQYSMSKEVLHLAMHAFVNDSAPLYSGLVFSIPDPETQLLDDSLAFVAESVQLEQQEKDGFLHAYEIYNLNLDARLVVLSACNTGTGKLQNGEGIMSLARAFQYAGCQGIVMSLWQVDDLATSELMQYFYQHLTAHAPKDEALRQAKLDYLTAHPDTPPHYWAGFVLVGDHSPLSRPFPLGGWFGIGFGVFLAFFLLRKKSGKL